MEGLFFDFVRPEEVPAAHEIEQIGTVLYYDLQTHLQLGHCSIPARGGCLAPGFQVIYKPDCCQSAN